MTAALVLFLAIGLLSYAWRKRSRNIRLDTLDKVSTLVAELQTFDGVANTALTLVQEVEVVARGYRVYVSKCLVAERADTNCSVEGHLWHQYLEWMREAKNAAAWPYDK